MMNEQGGRAFDRYTDADGADLRGDEIGTWDEVDAPRRARFVSAAHKVAFSLGAGGGGAAEPRPGTHRRAPRLVGFRLLPAPDAGASPTMCAIERLP